MKKFDLQVDVGQNPELPGKQHLACSVFLPDSERLLEKPVVIFAVPGGGYSRGYFDMHFDGYREYSEAEYHSARGALFVSCDHIGVGESSQPDPHSITFEVLASTYATCVRNIVERLRNGEIGEGYPPLNNLTVLGIGQSMGGCVTILTQGQHAVFEGIGVLGFSAIHTCLPQKNEQDVERARLGTNYGRDHDLSRITVEAASRTIADFVYPFHWEDVPAPILSADMDGGYPLRGTAPPFGSTTTPPCAVQMMSPGCVAEEASEISVPVFLAVGERDTSPDPWAEPGAFPHSRDIQLSVIPRMAHMHNFAGTRKRLWRRTFEWATSIANGRDEN